VTTIIHPNPVQLETARISPNRVPLLENCDPSKTVAGELVGCAHSGRAGAEDNYVGRMLTRLLGYIH